MSWSASTAVIEWQIMRPILRVDMYTCQTCSTCQARLVCKTRAIVQYERGDLPAIEHERCRGCMVCVPACPFGAVVREAAPLPKDT
jgi:Pyruvate/2-oxoacid:ferredoxin oxidoreductase delta subunit